MAASLTAGSYRFTVPNISSAYCKLRLTRAAPRSVAVTDTLFAISNAVSLQAFGTQVVAEPAAGVRLSWQTQPAAEDLAGYELVATRASGVTQTLLMRARENTFFDPSGSVGDRYTLAAVNMFGDKIVLGSQTAVVALALEIGHAPYAGGDLEVSFASSSSREPLRLSLFDVAGREVGRLVDGAMAAGAHKLIWRGQTNAGSIRSGLYFLRLRQGDEQRTQRLVVIR